MVTKTKTGVVIAGSYGDATLKTPGTPINPATNEVHNTGKTKSNGVVPGSPRGEVTFCDAPGAPRLGNASGEAVSSVAAKAKTKVVSSKQGKSFRQGKGNTGTSAAGAPLAVKLHY